MIHHIAKIARIALTTAALLLLAGAPLSHAQSTQPKLEYLMTYKAILEPPMASTTRS